MTSLTFKSLPLSEQSNTAKLIGIPPPCYFCSHLLHLYSTFLDSARTGACACLNPLYSRCSLTVSQRYPIGIIEQGQMIKGPMTINAGEIKNSSHLLHLSFSSVSQCPSPPFRHTQFLKDWDCCVYLRKRCDISGRGRGVKRAEEVKAADEEEEEVVQEYQRWWSDRWDVTECHSPQHPLISMTQLSQPYFSEIKRPYGKRACPRGEEREESGACMCVETNKLAVCRWSSVSLLPPFGSPPSNTILSFWHGNGSKLMKTLHSFSDNSTGERHKHFLHTSSRINHQEAPPTCTPGAGWAGSCLIS